MKKVLLLYILFFCLMVSCYEPYFPETESTRKVLVVNGLITNQITPFHINLSYADPFDSTSAGVPVTSAEVVVDDGHGNHFLFEESENGDYVSDPLHFAGIPGYSYTLHIRTLDGIEYESDPQLLSVADSVESVYAEYDYKETIRQHDGEIVLSHGANILADIQNQNGSIQKYRFASDLVTQYFYTICPPFDKCYQYYCWQSGEPNGNINLTGGDYAVNSSSVIRHEVCFVDDNPECYALNYGRGSQVTTDYKFFRVHNRILYFTLYSLNNDAWLYYRSMDAQLRSDGKLFDPIAVQIKGNIKCVSNSGNKVFGFFEASTVSYSAYSVDFRNLTDGQPSLKRVPYILPSEPVGHMINSVPAFWIY